MRLATSWAWFVNRPDSGLHLGGSLGVIVVVWLFNWALITISSSRGIIDGERPVSANRPATAPLLVLVFRAFWAIADTMAGP